MRVESNQNIIENFKYNFFVNVLDASFFGFGIGFASFSTILPLFVSQMTNSAVLIGLVPAIHNMFWQIPQLFMAKKVSSLPRIKPHVLLMTINERLPYLGFALIAWFLPVLNKSVGALHFFRIIDLARFRGRVNRQRLAIHARKSDSFQNAGAIFWRSKRISQSFRQWRSFT